MIHEILIEIENRFFDVDTGHLVAYKVFSKDFYTNLNVSEFKLKEFLCNITKSYPFVDMCKLRPQLNIYCQRDGFYEEW